MKPKHETLILRLKDDHLEEIIDEVAAEIPFALMVNDHLLVTLVNRLRQLLSDRDAEPAHVKVFGQAEGGAAMANLVGGDAEAELSTPSGAKPQSAEMIVNARVAIDPAQLETVVRETLGDVAGQAPMRHNIRDMQRFRPGPPTPTYRITLG